MFFFLCPNLNLSPLSLTYAFFTYKNRHILFNLCNCHCSYTPIRPFHVGIDIRQRIQLFCSGHVCNFSPSCTVFPLKVVDIPLLRFTCPCIHKLTGEVQKYAGNKSRLCAEGSVVMCVWCRAKMSL